MKTKIFCDRRAFIKQVAVFGGFGVLLGIGKPAAAVRDQPEKQAKPYGQGYRLTEQVKKYYETARL